MKIYINGRFLSQKLTGVQRYAAEIVKAMDGLLATSEVRFFRASASLADLRGSS
ncbi:hypothetical protein [Bradyrhizobium sp. LTSPM299]|uniref:hypothetical protein n=1 Tax=Bradyrhizobium sp. LTSPM299 TaxID=1619233 RepID=UPI000A543284|nr:hypothetical protein [Bradyrhizobium sp. LTSPM299]